jgi:predicted aspartyl protease
VTKTGGRQQAVGGSKKFFFVLTFFLFFLLPTAYSLPPVFAQEFYRWTDDSGAVHFTDNIYSIPEKYRNQIEKRQYVPPRQFSSPVREQEKGKPQTAQIVVPFERQGGLIIVAGVVNRSTPVKFILDTGAEVTSLPRSLAPQLGVDPGSSLLITMQGMGGNTEVPLVELDSIAVGAAEGTDLDVLLSDTPVKDTGLLGGDFLADYKVNIQYAENQVTFEAGDRSYGGHTFEWWQKKFRMLHAIKRKYENIRDTRGAASTDLIAKQLAAVDRKLSELEGRASQAGIPREFRQ